MPSRVRKWFLTDLDSLNSRFTALANAFPNDKYSWRPGPGVRSVGEVFMHVASELYVFAPMIYSAQPSEVIPHPQEKGAMEKFEHMSTKPRCAEAPGRRTRVCDQRRWRS
jgi:hypothetical protein